MGYRMFEMVLVLCVARRSGHLQPHIKINLKTLGQLYMNTVKLLCRLEPTYAFFGQACLTLKAAWQWSMDS